MTIGPEGDLDNVSPADCAVRMATAGADVVGTNCYFDPVTTVETLAMMKEGLAKAGLLDKPTYLMAQPLGFHTQDATTKFGYGLSYVINGPAAKLPTLSLSYLSKVRIDQTGPRTINNYGTM